MSKCFEQKRGRFFFITRCDVEIAENFYVGIKKVVVKNIFGGEINSDCGGFSRSKKIRQPIPVDESQ